MSSIVNALNSMKPVFRSREFILALGGKCAYAYVALHRLKKAGRIESAKNGWWAKRGAAAQEIATAISYPCYLSFHSALHAHGLTTQIPRAVQLAVCRKAKKYNFAGGDAKEYRIKKEAFNGFEMKGAIPLASPEKAFLDCLRIPRACPQAVLVEAMEGINVWGVKKSCNNRMLKRLREVEKNASAGIA